MRSLRTGARVVKTGRTGWPTFYKAGLMEQLQETKSDFAAPTNAREIMPSAVDRFLAEARSNVSRRSVHVDTGANNVFINPVPWA